MATERDAAATQAALEAARAHHARGAAREARAAYRDVIARAPRSAAALAGLALLEAQTGRLREAVILFEAALGAAPAGERAAIHAALAAAHRRLGEGYRALEHYRAAARLQPASAHAAMSLGAALADAGAYAEAAGPLSQALSLQPDLIAAHEALAIVLNRLGRHDEALAAASRGLNLAPDDAQLARSLAQALKELGRLDAAASVLSGLLDRAPDDLDARFNLGGVLKDQGRTAQAVACYRELVARAPQHAAARIALCMAHLPPLCSDEAERLESRAAYAAELQRLAEWTGASAPGALADGVGVSQPFYLAYQGENDVELQRQYGSLLCRAMAHRFPPAQLASYDGREKIRIGFVSGFFRDHANWRLPTRGWVETMDRSRFELIGYHTSAVTDATTQEAARSFDGFVQGPLPVEAWRARIAADRPHVLVYPEIGMDPVVVQLAAQRLAPVQCVSWGHPVTSGLPTVDCFLSSAEMEPPGAQAAYTERLVRLPGLSTPCRLPPRPPAIAARAEFGARKGATIFWCAQSPQKYLPRFDSVFPRIAARVPDSQFVFSAFPGSDELTERFRSRLRAAFAAHGLDIERRCIFLRRVTPETYRAMMAASDIFLDSIGWSGCNSLLEALACGKPVVTLEGDSLRARHGAAILSVCGLERHICQSTADYVRLATELAAGRPSDPEAWSRERLEHRLGDAAPVRALEEMLRGLLTFPAGPQPRAALRLSELPARGRSAFGSD